ncbi:MAG: hypothetical protein ACR2F6_00435 [Mycobacteriales bacterium]
MILGAWGAVIPFIGPYFNYAYLPDQTWHYTLSRLCLEVIPGAAAVLGGLMVLGTARRGSAILGAWLAALAGAWFAVGPVISQLRHIPDVEAPANTATYLRVLEQIGFFVGLGVAILFFAALALGRSTVIGVRETEYVARHRADDVRAAETTVPSTGTAAGAAKAYDDGGAADEAPRERRAGRSARTWSRRRSDTAEPAAEESEEDRLHRST